MTPCLGSQEQDGLSFSILGLEHLGSTSAAAIRRRPQCISGHHCIGQNALIEWNHVTHQAACANSRQPIHTCQCSCNGELHGIGTAPVANPAPNPRVNGRAPQMASAVCLATAASAFHSSRSVYTPKFAEWLVETIDWNADDFDAAQDLVDGAADAMNSALVDQLGKLASAQANELRGPLTRAIGADHLLCSLCAVVLEMHDTGKDAMHKLVDSLARHIVLSLDFASSAVAALANLVLSRVLKAGADVLWASAINPAAIQLVRFVGADCPAWDEHPEGQIFRLCAAPLLKSGLLEIEGDEFKRLFTPDAV